MGFDDEFDEELDEELDEVQIVAISEHIQEHKSKPQKEKRKKYPYGRKTMICQGKFLEDDLDEDLDEPSSKTPEEVVESKTPATRVIAEGKKISVYFMSTIGPGEKKQKLNVNTGNNVGDVKETVANLFGLDPADFHLSSGGLTMDEGSFLKDYDISDGDDILLIPASTAG